MHPPVLRHALSQGPVAQWIRHRSTEPEIVGSSPTRVKIFPVSVFLPHWGRPKDSAAGTRTRVARVRAEYPNQLDYSGDVSEYLGSTGLETDELVSPAAESLATPLQAARAHIFGWPFGLVV